MAGINWWIINDQAPVFTKKTLWLTRRCEAIRSARHWHCSQALLRLLLVVVGLEAQPLR